MQPRLPFVPALVVLVVLAATVAAVAGPGADRPACHDCNVLFVEVDPLRADHMGVYGYDRNTTPTIDRIAADSYVFDHQFAHSAHTTPSLFSTFTGRYPSQHGVIPAVGATSEQRAAMTVLPEVLQDAGYRTVGISGGGNTGPDRGFDQGFDRYRMTRDIATRDSIIRDAVRGTDPFFLYLQTFRPHHPYFPDDPYDTMFGPSLPAYRERSEATVDRLRDRYRSWDNMTASDIGRRIFDRFYRPDYFLPARTNATRRAHLVGQYDGLVRASDDRVATVLDLLREAGELEDTIIVIGSAHGEEFNEHGGWMHSQLYNEVMHVPFILHLPGQDGQHRIDAYTANIDIGPTLLDVLDIDAPAFRERAVGRSLTGVMRGGSLPDRHILAEHDQDQVALVDTATRRKYLRIGGNGSVYDLDRDWDEQRPLDNATLRDRMATRLDAVYDDLAGAEPFTGTWPYGTARPD